MDYTKLGRSDVEVSRICMGAMGFGEPVGIHKWVIGAEETEAVVKAGLEAGITFFDTAHGYNGGTSEHYLGQALRKLAKRDEVQVATKFGTRTPEEKEAGVDERGHVRACFEESLERLGMDYVDLYICHMWDYGCDMEVILRAMSELVDEGRVRAIGVSNCFAWQLAHLNDVAAYEGLHRLDSIQGHYNLLFREEEREMAPYCHAYDVSMTPYSALASGRLTRLPGAEQSKRMATDTFAKGKYDATAEEDAVIINRVHDVAEELGVTMADVSLAWLLTKVTAPVVGMTRPDRVASTVAAKDVHLTSEQIAYLEEPYVPHALVGVMAQNR